MWDNDPKFDVGEENINFMGKKAWHKIIGDVIL